MSTLFGEVAELYDDVRPSFPAELAGLVLEYARPAPAAAVEIGAGTGKATALFAGRGFPITCLEPDERMSARLIGRFADVTVVTTTFEEWRPPADGVPLIFAALCWHWLQPVRRAELAARALAPGGTLAVIGRKTWTVDERMDAAISGAFDRFPPPMRNRPPLPEYALPELYAQPDLADVRLWTTSYEHSMDTDRYLQLQETFSPFRFRDPGVRAGLAQALREAVDALGGVVHMRLDTHVVLARKI